ncbi:hypothetical protein A2U01_0017879, partial [Trifolium medium]|nr:hypothetical protein [Trifolium medium]
MDGFSGDSKDVNGASSNWNPIAPLFPSSMKGSSNRKKKGGKRSGVSTSKKIRKDFGNAGGRETAERPRRSATGAAAGNGN